jgi:hypothetical protein
MGTGGDQTLLAVIVVIIENIFKSGKKRRYLLRPAGF